MRRWIYLAPLCVLLSACGGGGGGFDSGSSSAVPLEVSSGGAYTVPAGFDPLFVGLSNTIGVGGSTAQAPTTGNSVGLAYDLSKSLIVPIGIANTKV